jgi:hypothetical protein
MTKHLGRQVVCCLTYDHGARKPVAGCARSYPHFHGLIKAMRYFRASDLFIVLVPEGDWLTVAAALRKAKRTCKLPPYRIALHSVGPGSNGPRFGALRDVQFATLQRELNWLDHGLMLDDDIHEAAILWRGRDGKAHRRPHQGKVLCNAIRGLAETAIEQGCHYFTTSNNSAHCINLRLRHAIRYHGLLGIFRSSPNPFNVADDQCEDMWAATRIVQRGMSILKDYRIVVAPHIDANKYIEGGVQHEAHKAAHEALLEETYNGAPIWTRKRNLHILRSECGYVTISPNRSLLLAINKDAGFNPHRRTAAQRRLLYSEPTPLEAAA